MDMERRFRHLQRATVARSALDVIALIFLGCGFAFWGVAFWQLLAPPALASLGTVSVLVLTVVYTLAAPLLLSMLVPTTPAGQLLQKTQWATVGFPAIIAAALFLCYEGYTLIAAWLSVQGGIDQASGRFVLEASGQVTPMAISLSIAFILIPALAWVQLTPERWLQQIQQAHQVRRLEIQQSGEIAILKTHLLWVKQKAAMDCANLLPGDNERIRNTLRGLFMSIGDTQRDIARTLGISAELERDMLGDEQIALQLDYVAQEMLAEKVEPSIPAVAAIPAPPQSAAVSRSQPQYAAEYQAARQRLTGVWSSTDLGEVIGKSPRSALERIYAWIAAGLVMRGADGKGMYYFTESEAA